MFYSMVLILIRLNIILKEDFDLIVHLWSNILKEERGNDSHATKRK